MATVKRKVVISRLVKGRGRLPMGTIIELEQHEADTLDKLGITEKLKKDKPAEDLVTWPVEKEED